MHGLSSQDKTIVELSNALRHLWLSRQEVPEYLFGQFNDALEDAGQCALAAALRENLFCTGCLVPQRFHRGPGNFTNSLLTGKMCTITRVMVGCIECSTNGRHKGTLCHYCANLGYLPLWLASSYACRVCFGLGKARFDGSINCSHCHGLCIFTQPPEDWTAAAFHWQPCEVRRRLRI